jgi:predicted outer membrane protein
LLKGYRALGCGTRRYTAPWLEIVRPDGAKRPGWRRVAEVIQQERRIATWCRLLPQPQESIMQKNKALKGLLAVSAAAAMFATFGVQAQTATTPSAADMQKQSEQGKPNMTGKTARDGTVNNTNSQGMEDRSGQAGSSTAGGTTSSSSGMAGHSAHGQSGAGMSGSTGTGATGMSGSSSGQSGAAGATASGTTKMSKADSKAIMDMAMVNMAEVDMGKLAQSKSQNPEVKTFAQQMIDDHTKGLQEVQTVAQAKGITLPTELDAKHKAMSAKLAKLDGDKFDREYMKVGGTASHKEALAMLNKNEKSAKDADVKGLATKMKPTVEQHLKAAQQMPAAKSGTTSGK